MPSRYGGQSQQRWGDNTVNQNEYMRDIQLVDLSGKVCATLDARRKGMLLLAFFDTTSPVCRLLLPYLQKLADNYKESGKLTVWAISESDEASTRAFADEIGVKFPILLDRDRYHALVWGVTAFPTLYLSDGGGVVQRKVAGWSRTAMEEINVKIGAGAGVETVVPLFEEGDASPAILRV